MTREDLLKMRELLKKAAESLVDEDAMDAVGFFPKYQVGKAYAVGDRFQYNDNLYKVLQAHTSQEDWEPNKTPALYLKIAHPDEIPVWVQPTGAHDAYQTGDKVHYPGKNDPVYESLIDNNAWSPTAYPAGWKLVE